MISNQLSRIKLDGYKSIQACDLGLGPLNVIIGPNGAGKSNFIGFFRLIQQLLEGNLQRYISKNGGPDTFLYHGRKRTSQLTAEIHFDENAYKLTLEPTVDNRMMFASEGLWNADGWWSGSSGHFETDTVESPEGIEFDGLIIPVVRTWRVYHFHDTSEFASVKQRHSIADNEYLRHDAKNLAAFLFRLKEYFPDSYAQIVATIKLVAPFFGDFRLRRVLENPDQIELEWSETGEDEPLKAYVLSDGTLRFICLATVFLQPEELQPQTILVDEPELGLHPYAIKILASMIRSASKTRQVIVSTQSVTLLNEFEPGDVIVADRKDGASVLHRLEPADLEKWLEDYTLGELWEKNILGGRPAR